MVGGAGGFMSSAVSGLTGKTAAGLKMFGNMMGGMGGMSPGAQPNSMFSGWGDAFGGFGDKLGGFGDRLSGMFGGGGGEGGGEGNIFGRLADRFTGLFKGGGEGDAEAQSLFGSLSDKLKAKLSDKDYMSDMLLRVGSNYAGAALAGDGLSDEERKLFDFLSGRVKHLRGQNQQLFDKHLNAALEVQNQARQYDPEYWGLKAQRDVQIADAAAGREIEQKAAMEQGGQGVSAADKRRAALDTTRQAQSAFLEGREAAQDAKMKGLVAGAGLLPQAAPTSDIVAGLDVSGLYGDAEGRRKSAADAMGTTISGVLGIDKPKSTGKVTNEETDVGLKNKTETET
jgi:hypothetical protein